MILSYQLYIIHSYSVINVIIIIVLVIIIIIIIIIIVLKLYRICKNFSLFTYKL